jgi:metallo-beta-lactamase class B
MHRHLLLVLALVCALCLVLQAQTSIAPKPPLTMEDAARGKELQAKSDEVRAAIVKIGNATPTAPFKIIGNLYTVGVLNGKAYLLTSPQGHILFGAAYANAGEIVEKNVQALGFKMTDIKVILINHYHNDAAGAGAYLKQKTGAQVMAAPVEIGYIERGGVLPGQGGGGGYPPVKVDRALFEGDVIKVGPLSVTTYITPGHSPESTSFLFTVRDGNKDYRVFQFCCWEYPADLWQNPSISEAGVRHTFETFRKVLPVDVYLSGGAYENSGILNLPATLSVEELYAKLKADPSLWIDREMFPAFAAAREVEFEEKLQKLKAANPIFK